MPFYIRLLDGTNFGPDNEHLGEICVETFIERFLVYPLAGTVDDVVRGWSRELRRLVSGADSVGLPIAANMAWVLYRFTDKVIVHQILILPGGEAEFDSDGNITRVPAYEAYSEDGETISAWSTTVDAVQEFLASE